MRFKSVVLALTLAVNAGAASFVAETTAYCAARCCTKGLGRTASGFRPVQGITVAAPRMIPFGTIVHIEGIGRRRVEDRMHPRFPNRWDVYFHRHSDALRFGKKKLKITIIKT